MTPMGVVFSAHIPIAHFLRTLCQQLHSMSRILIETTVRQTLKGLKENPKRNIRNLVDSPDD